jgi:hypothetical protein
VTTDIKEPLVIKQLVMSAAVVASLTALPAHAQQGIAYLSSGGYALGGSSIATTAAWTGQSALSGFSGYGQINWNGRCLAGKGKGQPLAWEACRNDASQRWKFQNRQLNNEQGWCADVEGGRSGANVRVVSWDCNSRAANQKWTAHYMKPWQVFATSIWNPQVRAAFEANAQKLKVGDRISLTTGNLVAAGGGNLVAAGGGNLIGNDGSTLVAAGGGNLVAAGGGN